MDLVSNYLDIKNSGFKRWCFTCFNPTPEKIAAIQQFAINDCLYLRYQWECAPKTGNIHLQGFFISRKPQYTVKKMYTGSILQEKLPGCHVAVMKKTTRANYMYCTKERTKVADKEKYVWKHKDFNIHGFMQFEEDPWLWCYFHHNEYKGTGNGGLNNNFYRYWETLKSVSDIILTQDQS